MNEDGRSHLWDAEATARYILSLRKSARSVTLGKYFSEIAWTILLALYGHKGANKLSVTSLAAHVDIPRSTAVRSIIKLQQDGYVIVTPDKRDKRASRVQLTPAGLKAVRHTFLAASTMRSA